jgi:hypothetical protein
VLAVVDLLHVDEQQSIVFASKLEAMLMKSNALLVNE